MSKDSMKIIGLLGGMSWESTAGYYKIINEEVRRRLGGLHSAKIALYSVDFAEIEALQHKEDWEAATAEMISAARRVAAAGADCLVICTNTMHRMAEQVASAINIPLLHIADTTANRLVADGVHQVGLLGTRFTMEQDFYRGRLESHGLTVIVPDEPDRDTVHRVIYDELCKGKIYDESRQQYQRIMRKLVQQGSEAVILGCTEISMLVCRDDSEVPLFDTTRIHAEAAVDFALGGST
jgi:aspartate racemase